MNTIPLTVRGAEKLKDELARLKTVERHEVIQAISEARAQGDLSENAEYEAAKDKQGFIEGRILELDSKLAAAQVIDPATLDAGGRIVFDTGEREGKRSRAFCSPVKVPDEVYLVLRPHGGQTDWNTFLHEYGHALHFAHMRPDHPMEFRFMGDNSVTEGYAMLFDHLMQDAGWLQRYTGLEKKTAPAFLRRAGFATGRALLLLFTHRSLTGRFSATPQ